MVAAAKLRRAQEAAEAGRPYAQRLEAVVASLASKVTLSASSPKLLTGTGKDQIHLFVVATSGQGTGGCVQHQYRSPRPPSRERADRGWQDRQILYYRPARAAPCSRAASANRCIIRSSRAISASSPSPTRAGYAEDIVARFEAGEFDVAHLFYSHFKSVLTQEPTEQQIIPVALPANRMKHLASLQWNMNLTRNRSLPTCFPATSPSSCSAPCARMRRRKQGSKMTAMDNATRNAGDLINGSPSSTTAAARPRSRPNWSKSSPAPKRSKKIRSKEKTMATAAPTATKPAAKRAPSTKAAAPKETPASDHQQRRPHFADHRRGRRRCIRRR